MLSAHLGHENESVMFPWHFNHKIIVPSLFLVVVRITFPEETLLFNFSFEGDPHGFHIPLKPRKSQQGYQC